VNNSAASKDLKISLSEEKEFEDVQHYLTAPPLAEIPKVFHRKRFIVKIAITTRPNARVVHAEQVLASTAKSNVAQAAEDAACSE
jgi:hypothetical protein